jgi:hypothetical protein
MGRLAGGRDRVAAGGARFAQASIHFVQTVLSLHHKGVVEGLVAMQHDLLPCVEPEEHVGNALLHVHLQDGEGEVGKVTEGLPGMVLASKCWGMGCLLVG